jgi:hypothetical protein
MVFRKGSARHVLAGQVFVAAMLTMSAAATYLAIVKHQVGNIEGGIFAFYLVLTAWLTARRRPGETSRFDWGLLLIPAVLGGLMWIGAVRLLGAGMGSIDGVPVGMVIFMGTVMLLAAVGDVRMLLSGGVSGTKRLARHLWRMCFGLFVAAGSFFMGPNNRPLRLLTNVGIGQHLPAALFSVGLYLLLTILPLVLLIFWLIRVRVASAYKGQAQRAPV